MFRHCLNHPVTPLLSLLAPLLRPFRSPVRGLRGAVTERGKPLAFLVFAPILHTAPGRRKVFPLLFGLNRGVAHGRRAGRLGSGPLLPAKDRRGSSVVIPAQVPPDGG